MLDQEYPAELVQVVVADGMSDDGTRAVVDELARAHPRHTVEIVDNPGRIVPTGFNAALARARGEVIVRVDGHTIIAPDYVAECVAALASSGADNVGGRMDAVGSGPVGEAIAIATSSPFGVGNSHFHYAHGQRWVDTVYLGAWPREVFGRIGSFDPEMVRNQDDEFNYRLTSAGGRILLTDRIRSRYFSRASLRTVFRQYRQYGTWKVRVLQKHPRRMRRASSCLRCSSRRWAAVCCWRPSAACCAGCGWSPSAATAWPPSSRRCRRHAARAGGICRCCRPSSRRCTSGTAPAS